MEWNEIFEEEFKKDYFIKLNSFIENEYKTKTIFPIKDNIFKAFKLTSFNNVKVVILGQDPYHEINQATGLAFSVPQTCKIPPSLVNIFKEIKNEYGRNNNKNGGDLTYLAKQGVFLLNTILTVELSKPLSHKNKGWEIFTDKIIEYLNLDNSPKVFILLGNNAISKSNLITNPNHLILKAPHPSPLSAYHGFFNSNIFKDCNNFLIKNNKEPINW